MLKHYQNIIVAVDGSKEAEYAFGKSLEIAKLNESAVIYLTYIVDTRVYTAYKAYDAIAIKRTHEEINQLFTEYKTGALEAGVNNVNIIIENGIPKSDITKKIARRVNADLIVCGATGHSKLERLLMGSVSEAIVRTAKCDVLVIRTP